MGHQRRRGTGPKRMTDWSGIVFDDNIVTAAPVEHVNLWTPVTEDKHATVVRIVGEIYVAPNTLALQSEGAFSFFVSAGIQVVNRAAGTTGAARNPRLEDDLEGGEWLWLRHYCFQYVAEVDGTSGAVTHLTGMQDFVNYPDPHVDIRVKRKLDLSQDELLLTVAGQGTSMDVSFCGSLRMLLLQG